MKTFYYIFFLALAATLGTVNAALAQIVGPSTVGTNVTNTYYFDDGTTYTGIKWIGSGSPTINTTVIGTRYYAFITWSSAGARVITLQDISGTVATKNVTINNCTGSIATPSVVSASRCGPGSVTLSTTNLPAGYLLRVFDGTNPNMMIYMTDGDSFYTTPSLSVTTNYYFAFYNVSTGCQSSKVLVTATINPPLSVDAGPDQTGASTCGLTGVFLNASPSTGTWSVVSGSGGTFTNVNLANSTFNGTAGSSYTLRWTTGSGNCTGSDDVNITFNQNPSAPNAGPDQTGASTCGQTSVTLTGTASSPSIGSGTWIISPDSSPGGSIASPLSPTTTFSGQPGGVYGVVWRMTSGPCVLQDEVMVTFNRYPTPANAGSDRIDASTCGASSIQLAATPTTFGMGTWSVITGDSNGSFGASHTATSNVANSTFNGTPGVPYTLRWTTTAAPCSSSSSDVHVTLNPYPTSANAGPDQNLCGQTTTTLAATAASGGSWSIVSGSGGSFGNSGSNASTFTGNLNTTYVLRWTVSTTYCGSTSDDVTITLNTVPNAAVSSGSQTICSGSNATINITNPNGVSGTNFTILASLNNATIPDISSPGNQVTGTFYNTDRVSQGIATYTVTPFTAVCTGNPVTATVIINNTPDAPNPPTQLVYEGNPAFFQVIAPEGAITQWYATNTSPSAFAVGDTYQNTLATDPLTYYVSYLQGSCNSPKVLITAIPVGKINPSSILTENVRVPGKTDDGGVNHLTLITEKSTTVSYIDGLSRIAQSIGIRASESHKDIVQPVEYDSYGRSSKDYLPYTKDLILAQSYTVDNITGNTIPTFQPALQYQPDQLNFYQAANDKIANDGSPYAIATYEASPLGRPLTQSNAGDPWQSSHKAQVVYSFNAATGDDVYLIQCDPLRIGTGPADVTLSVYDANNPVTLASHSVRLLPGFATAGGAYNARIGGTTQYYPANTLSRIEATDENGNKEIIYQNGAGRVIARKKQLDGTINNVAVDYLQTYYVYDDLNRLRYIIPPAGFAALQGNGFVFTQTILDNHLHQFMYDNRGRLTQKKTPGQDWIYYAYDKFNRLVLVQDANLRPQKKWAFVKYDLAGRSVMSGLYTNTTQTDLASIQTLLTGQYASGTFYESRGTALYGYTNQSFPTANASGSALEVLSVNYYDDYNFDNTGGDDYTYDKDHLAKDNVTYFGLPAQAGTHLHGFPTGGRKLVLGTSNWIASAVFYDNLGRPIQAQTNNHLNLAGLDKGSVEYDFEGKALQTKADHNGGGTNQVTVLQKPQYRTDGVAAGVKHQINANAEQLLSNYQYNELWQLVTRQLHNTSGNSFMQNVDYRYNINGWLTSINNAQLTNDGGLTNSDDNDYFGIELLYNATDPSGLSTTPLFNGNVSAVKWKGPGGGSGLADQRSYVFSYDKTDKLLGATFQKSSALGQNVSWNQEQNTLNESMTYDHNGNILKLQRNQNLRGLTGTTVTSTAQLMDDLSYIYTNGNQLSKVTDATGLVTGFKDGANASTEYRYDTHGNLTSDKNKGIDSIQYNVLGKPQQIHFTDGRVINYTYDASGNKLKMSSTVNGTTTTTDYANGFVYTNASLSFFASPEGKVVKNGSSYEYQYAITDHQGNTRIVFTSAAPAVEAPSAGFENTNQTGEAPNFQNYPSSFAWINTVSSNSHTGSNSLRLNGSALGGQIGLAKNYHVFPGDKLKLEAWAQYTGSSDGSIANVAPALLGIFQLPTPAPGETGTPSSAINAWGGMEANGSQNGDNVIPKAFLNIILFDKDYKFVDATYQQVTSTSFTQFVAQYTVKEEGYAYMFLSNENETEAWVYFDDVTMTYTPSSVIQSNEYYPFGLQTAESWTRTGSSNNFLYNEGSELNTVSGMYDLPYRNYDAALGRFFQVDPLAVYDHDASPFAYARNNPVVFTDPSGLMVPAQASTWTSGQMRGYWINYGQADSNGGSFSEWYADMGGGGGGGGSITISIPIGSQARQPRYNASNSGRSESQWVYLELTFDLSDPAQNESYNELTAELTGNYYRDPVSTGVDRGAVTSGIGSTGSRDSSSDQIGNSKNSRNNNDDWKSLTTILNVWGLSSGTKDLMIEGGVALQRGMNISKINDISLLRTLGSSGTKYLKFSKGLGTAGGLITTGYSVSKVIDQNEKGGWSEVFEHRDVLDAGVGVVGLGATALTAVGIISNPVGWGIGIGVLVYGGATLIYDAVTEDEKSKQ